MKLTRPGRQPDLHRPASAAAGRQGAPRGRSGRHGGRRDAGAGARRRRGGRGRLRRAPLRHRTRKTRWRRARRPCGTSCRTMSSSTRCSATPKRPTRAFADAAHVVRWTSHIGRVTGVPLEPRSALGSYDAATGRYTLYAGSGGAVRQKREIAAVLGLAPETLRVLSYDVGGNFGTRNRVYRRIRPRALGLAQARSAGQIHRRRARKPSSATTRAATW